MSTHAPYGYKKSAKNKKQWEIDEEAAEVVRLIFQLCIEGNSLIEISRILEKKHILCPSAYLKEKGTPVSLSILENPYRWCVTAIGNILDRYEYLGHTVNFKTYRKSYKNKKKFKHDKKDWKIFENTHDPIIDQTTFDIVQTIRAGRIKKTKRGYKSVFSGMLYCAECGAKLSFRSTPKQNSFCCSNYRHATHSCTMHFIRHEVVEKIVLANLQSTLSYVKEYEKEFIDMVMQADSKSRNKEMRKANQNLTEKEQRYNELDDVFKHLYEDRISGRLTEERFAKLSATYEKEQKQIADDIVMLQKEIEDRQQQSVNANSFISIVQKYTDIQELTPEIVHEFIEKIIVHEADKSSGKRTQEIEIIYRYIGKAV